MKALNLPNQRGSYIKYIFTLLYQTKVLLIGQIDVWLIKMENTNHSKAERETYYVYGSPLFAVPSERMYEIPRLKSEFHDVEAKKATLFAWARKLA